MNNPTITAYITKDALTKGIQTVKAVHLVNFKPEYGSMIRVDGDPNEMIHGIKVNNASYYGGDTWQSSPQSALLQAENMRKEKIKKLKKRIDNAQKEIAKLEAIKFEVKD